jgi:hypothetical protein
MKTITLTPELAAISFDPLLVFALIAVAGAYYLAYKACK